MLFFKTKILGEPFPVYYEKDIPRIIKSEQVLLPKINKFLPTENGDPPLGRAKPNDWNVFKGDRMEQNTMPGWAGSFLVFFKVYGSKKQQRFLLKRKLKILEPSRSLYGWSRTCCRTPFFILGSGPNFYTTTVKFLFMSPIKN